MGRKAKKDINGIPPWLMTFTDIMTLMLAFFVLLVSMAIIDEKRKLVALGSVIGTFGPEDRSRNFLAEKDRRITQEIGPMQGMENLEKLKPILWEDARDDVRFAGNRLMEIVSISADVLFAPGEARLTPEGEALIARMAPTLSDVEADLLLAGHASTTRDESLRSALALEHPDAAEGGPGGGPHLNWELSLWRSLAVYRALTAAGMDPTRLRVEAFAHHRPRFGMDTAEDRRRNRRVDIVLDRRGQQERARVEAAARAGLREEESMNFKGFRFDLDASSGGRP